MSNRQSIRTLEHFEHNLDEASSAFIAWVCFLLSGSEPITGKLHGDYRTAWGNVPEFYQICLRNAQISWVVLFCHVIEKRNDSFSLAKLDPKLFKSMVEDKHKTSIEMIKKARDEVFAHKTNKEIPAGHLPSLEDTKNLLRDVFAFFGAMNSKYNRPHLVIETIFNNQFFAEDFEKIVTILNPQRNLERESVNLRIGNKLTL